MKLRTTLIASAALLVFACSSSTDGADTLVKFDDAAGDACAAGGTRVRAGRDVDGDGELAEDEVEDESVICTGEGSRSAGEDGADGSDGESGADGDAGVDGTDGADGSDGVDGMDGDSFILTIDLLPPGEDCQFGGRRVLAGIDSDDDGDVDEVLERTDLCAPAPAGVGPVGFRLLSKYTAPGGPIAEIVSASPDGSTMVYTSSQTQTIGFADITNAKAPALLGTLNLGSVTGGDGEPTSVAFSPDGEFVVVVVKDTSAPVANADPGYLVVVNATTRTVVGQVALGVGPDSVTLTPDGTRAIVAIEDEENESGNNAAQARPGSIQIVDIDYAAPASSTVTTVAINASIGNMPTDPQPEYIDVTADGKTAVITLQENNLVAVLDLETGTITDYIDLGTSVHARADLLGDKFWNIDDAFEGQLQPDGVCLLSDDVHFITANEGDTGNGVFPVGGAKHAGGRGFSIFRTDGARVYDSGDAAEWASYEHGAYPDARSPNRGVEPEGCGAGTFGGREFAFVTGERNNSLFVVDVANPAAAKIHQVLGAPARPESVTTIASRGLVLVGGEGDGAIEGGGIWLYEAVDDAADLGHGPHVYTSRANDATFSALSGLSYDQESNVMLAVPDNAYAEPRIFRFSVDDAARRVELVDEIALVNRAGVPLTGMDSEGIVVNPEGGFIVATEGTGGNGVGAAACQGTVNSNRVYFFERTGKLDPRYGGGDGIVDLPCGAQTNAFNWANMTSNGFEGVTVVDEDPSAPGGLVVYVGFQRPLTGETRNRIGAYDVDTATWNFYYYQLDADALPAGSAAGLTFISELIYVGGDQFAVIERDQGAAGTAVNKTIRTFTLSSGTVNNSSDPVDKETAVDLLAHPFRFDQEKLEGLALVNGALFVVNDNDGGIGHSFFLRLSEGALGGVPEIVPEVVLSEINTDLAPGDWVELQNLGAEPVDVSGWSVRNGAGAVHSIAGGSVIPPGGYLAVSGLAFDLGSTDSVSLVTLLGSSVDTHSWTTHLASASRCGVQGLLFWPSTGAASATPSGDPSPGSANHCDGPLVDGQGSVLINEVRSQGNDFVELINLGLTPVDVGNWKLSDNSAARFAIPAGTVILPGGFLVIEGDWTTGPMALTFGLGSADSAILYSPYNEVVDSHTWTVHQNTGSRCPDGGAFAATNRTATSGAANSCL